MATIKEDYVSFETAKLLKEKGFDEVCYRIYDTKEKELFGTDGIEFQNHEADEETITAPTLQMAMKWLREVYMIDIVITPSMFRRKYNVCIYKKEKLCCIDFDGDTLSPSYEQACEAALKFCLEHLI